MLSKTHYKIIFKFRKWSSAHGKFGTFIVPVISINFRISTLRKSWKGSLISIFSNLWIYFLKDQGKLMQTISISLSYTLAELRSLLASYVNFHISLAGIWKFQFWMTNSKIPYKSPRTLLNTWKTRMDIESLTLFLV